MKTIKLEEREYEILENIGDCFQEAEVRKHYTDYFYDYDYIIGDYSYNKMRLKGFCDKGNKKWNSINDISLKDAYIKGQCAPNCKLFVLKKVKNA